MNEEKLLKKLRVLFREELEVNLRVIEKSLLSVDNEEVEDEGGGFNKDEQINEIYRAMHSIKGAAATVKADKLKELAHVSEYRLAAVKNGTELLDDELVRFLFECVDRFRAMSVELESDSPQAEPDLEPHSSASNIPVENVASDVRQIGEVPKKKSIEDASPVKVIRDYTDDFVSISSARLERMQRLVLDIDISLRVLSNVSDRFDHTIQQWQSNQVSSANSLEWRGALDDSGDIAKKVKKLQQMLAPLDEELLRANMQRFSDAFGWLPRMVRDQAIESGKKVRLEIIGGDVEVAGALVRLLNNPLRHLIRNAIDHGIESKREREEQGKSTTGNISIVVRSKSRRLEVEIRDDGRGLNLELIRSTANALGYEPKIEADRLPELIFQSGFSTSDTVSEISGRGIGLDAVRVDLMRYGGSIEIIKDDQPGAAFRLSLPIHAYRIRALQFSSAGIAFAIDCSVVDTVVSLSQTEDSRIVEGMFITSTDEPFPLIELSQLLQLNPASTTFTDTEQRKLIVLKVGDSKVGVVVETVDVISDQLIRELPERLGNLAQLQGSFVTQLGEIGYVLNPDQVISLALRTIGNVDQGLGKPSPSKGKLKLLVVDDTYTTSALIETILENAGFDIVSARDGEQAWRVLSEVSVDLMVTDLEMPILDGIDLIKRVRNADALKNLPIILLTGRDSKEDRMRGLEAGADVYLVKSAFDQSKLLETIHQLI